MTISNLFPHGVKFTYRKYCSDKVVLIEKKPILLCKTPVGKLTGMYYCTFTLSSFMYLYCLNLLGLEPVTGMSQWYPTPGLYVNRDVEGMYLLLSVPHLSREYRRLVPKALVQGCKSILEDLKLKINTHDSYEMGNSDLASWNEWFRGIIPKDEEDVADYVRSHRYECPLLNYFREGIQNDPSWLPPQPRTSFSIFPQHVVVALPSVQCQFDHRGPATPYMPIEMVNESDAEAGVITRYNSLKAIEFNRLKLLKKKGLLNIINRKVKEHGGRFAISGLTIERLCALVFDCDLNYFLTRLTDDFTHEQNVFLNGIFDGGESLNLNSRSQLVTINGTVVHLGEMLSITADVSMDSAVMNALINLNIDRDKRLCEAFNIVNEKKGAILLEWKRFI